MTILEASIAISDALETLKALTEKLEGVKQALDETVDWDSLEGTENNPER